MLCRSLLCLLGMVVASVVVAESAEPKRVSSPVGRAIGDFTLPDVMGRPWALADCKDAKAVVVFFLGTECPVNNAYLPRLGELHESYSDSGVRLVAINANQQDTAQRVAEHAKRFAIPFPVLKDVNNVVADRFGAEKTPEAFVLDARRIVRYRGRIDDQYGVGYKRPQPTRNDLSDALDEVLAGKAVSRPSTEVAGCFISRVAQTTTVNATVTFTKDVAPILQKNCQECHRPGQIGPMPLLTFDDAAAWSATIRQVVEERRMPPWHADPRHGKFHNDRRLPDAERDKLLAWIDQGCAPGRADEQPPPRQFAEGWNIGTPDVVLSMAKEYTVPAEAEEGIRYQYFAVPTGFDEDKWIQAAEVRPGNREVVHHVIVFVMPAGARTRDRNHPDGIGNGMLVAYAPGDQPVRFPPGTAKKIPKGHDLVFQMHYTPNGKVGKDRSSVGLIFAKDKPGFEAKTRGIAQRIFIIPPGASNHKVTSHTTFPRNVVLWNLFPHMHLRGKSFEYRVVYPDGKTDTLLSVPRYDFAWQTIYWLEKPLTLPAGSRIECTAHFDNSTANLNNPDPEKYVRWGDQTWEEMMIGFTDYSYTDPADAASAR